jgi:hypothetical protein
MEEGETGEKSETVEGSKSERGMRVAPFPRVAHVLHFL